jgi:transcriptional regulator GlxA family with amidase domain
VRIEVLVFDGFDELDSLGPFEVFSQAARIVGAGTEVALVTASGQSQVTASRGTQLAALPEWRPAQADVLVVPGGGFFDPGPGVARQIADGPLPKQLAEIKESAPDGFVLASVCTGAMLLSAAGLLTGRPATTNRAAHRHLADAGARLIDARVVDDGDIVTAGGISCGLDMAIHLTARLFGSDVALQVEEELEYQRHGTVWRR